MPRSFTDEELLEAWQDAESIKDVANSLYDSVGGGSYSTIKRAAERLELDYEDKKKAYKDKTVKQYSKKAPLKKKLLRERGRECESCGRETWKSESIPLDVHRIDENKSYSDCGKEDVKLLCPNCHRLTDNWGYNSAR